MPRAIEEELRAAAFAWLDSIVKRQGDVLDGGLLRLGFEFRGERVPLAVQQGIHKPKQSEAALSLRSAIGSPYDDHFDDEESLVYRYRGTDPAAWDNHAARRAYELQLPLVYLHAVARGRYAVVYPIYIVADDPAKLAFTLRAEPGIGLAGRLIEPTDELEARVPKPLERSYSARLVRVRLHQRTFRERVLAAYRQQCAMCRLKHTTLLDAAHIVPDVAPAGEPLVSNGISLCRIHHGAFDHHYLAIEPDSYRVRVRPALLREKDGPMLRHGLQELEGTRIQLPRREHDLPDPERLRAHWAAFDAAS